MVARLLKVASVNKLRNDLKYFADAHIMMIERTGEGHVKEIQCRKLQRLPG